MPQRKKQTAYTDFRVGKLTTIGEVCGELARLYRRTAHGHVDSADAARQSSILANLRQGLEQGLIELRLSNIENTILRLAANKNGAPLLESHSIIGDDDDEPS
jgi:hypothetical protein